MSINDPIVIWALGAAFAIIGAFITFLDRRLVSLRRDVDELKLQIAAHDGTKAMLDRMYLELKELTGLTNRIAGHLNIS